MSSKTKEHETPRQIRFLHITSRKLINIELFVVNVDCWKANVEKYWLNLLLISDWIRLDDLGFCDCKGIYGIKQSKQSVFVPLHAHVSVNRKDTSTIDSAFLFLASFFFIIAIIISRPILQRKNNNIDSEKRKADKEMCSLVRAYLIDLMTTTYLHSLALAGNCQSTVISQSEWSSGVSTVIQWHL